MILEHVSKFGDYRPSDVRD